MKKSGLLHKGLYWLNLLVALLLLVSFVLPYVPPKSFPTLSVLSLGVSPLILLNIVFASYWFLRLKTNFFLSGIILGISYFHFHPFVEFSSEGNTENYENHLKVLSYNVRLFNAYEKDPSKENVSEIISDIISTEQPDVFCIQEFYKEHSEDFSTYPYQYIHFKRRASKLGHAIFSKYPIIKEGAFDFEDSNNNALFVDIVKEEDTLRVYNLHLQSLSITPSVSSLQEGDTDRLRKRIGTSFSKQQDQVKRVLEHKKATNLPVLLCGDFNNTPFSYTYRKLKKGMNDAFLEKGNGLGRTYSFDSYPMRIDYIFGSKEMEVIRFETIKKSFSDHYPISATFAWSPKKKSKN